MYDKLKIPFEIFKRDFFVGRPYLIMIKCLAIGLSVP